MAHETLLKIRPRPISVAQRADRAPSRFQGVRQHTQSRYEWYKRTPTNLQNSQFLQVTHALRKLVDLHSDQFYRRGIR